MTPVASLLILFQLQLTFMGLWTLTIILGLLTLEDEDVQENDEHTDIHLILSKCATMGKKKRSIIVSSTEEPIRKSSRNRQMNSFLTDFV